MTLESFMLGETFYILFKLACYIKILENSQFLSMWNCSELVHGNEES